MPFTKIVTERLALRQLVANDAQEIFEYRSRPEVSRYQSWGVESRAEIQAQIESLAVTEPGMPGSCQPPHRSGHLAHFCRSDDGSCESKYSRDICKIE
jgi:hypothetical protein